MTSQEASSARLEAVDKVSSMLSTVELLSKLNSWCQLYEAERKANMHALSSYLEKHTSEIEANRSNLEQGEICLRNFVEVLKSTGKKGAISMFFSSHDGDSRRLASIQWNLNKIMLDTEAINALPSKAGYAQKLLAANNAQAVMDAYICLTDLEATICQIQNTLESNASLREFASHQSALGLYFEKVHKTFSELEEKLWSTVRNYKYMSLKHPEMLVVVLQVVEVQEQIDKQMTLSSRNMELQRHWRSRCIQNLEASVMELFAPLLGQASKLLGDEESTQSLLESILGKSLLLVEELQLVKRTVVPCFPPSYNILEVFLGFYTQHIEGLLHLFGACASNMSNANILKVLNWVEDCCSIIGMTRRSGSCSENLSQSEGVVELLDVYMNRIVSNLEGWVSNIVEKELQENPYVAPDGHLYTPGPIDFFRILDEQLDVILSSKCKALHLRMLYQACETMTFYQNTVRNDILTLQLPIEKLCTIANNSMKSFELGMDYAQKGAKSFNGSLSLLEDLKSGYQGFKNLAKDVVRLCGELVFSDPGFAKLFSNVGCSAAWMSGNLTGSIFATLDDFLHDFEKWLFPIMYTELARQLLHDCVSHFIAGILTQVRTLGKQEFQSMYRDISQVEEFFNGHIQDRSGVSNECRPLQDIMNFVSSDSTESFVLSYSILLDKSPAITPILLSNLLMARVAVDSEMTKSDAREILEACREVYLAKAAAQKYETATPKVASLGRSHAYLVALSAAQKRREYTSIFFPS